MTPRRLKILHLLSEYPPAKVYGLGTFGHGLTRAQAAAGDEVHVVTNSHGGAEDDVLRDGVHLHRIHHPNPPCPSSGQGEVYQWNHGVVSRVLDRLDALRDVDVVCGHDWLSVIAAREVAEVLERPLVVTFHDEVIGKLAGVLDQETRLTRDLEALTAHDANHVIANSHYIARQVARHYGLPPERITAIPGGIDPALFEVNAPGRTADFRAALAREDELLVVFAGRLDPEKGLGVLTRAIEQVTEARKDVRFAIAGTGRREDALRAAVGERARLLGYVKGEARSYLFRAADVVVIPSVYEPFGLVALEAMLCESAVVVSSAGGLAEIVRHERDGLVIPVGDPAALGEAVLRLAEDRGLRRRLAQAAATRARHEFSWTEIARRTRQVYERVVGRSPALCRAQPTLPPSARVTAVLETRDAPLHLETALEGLRRTEHLAFEVRVVDGSGPGAAERVLRAVDGARARGLDVRRVTCASEALAQATGEYVLFQTDEVEVPPGAEGWLTGLIWLMEDAGATSVSPTLASRADVGRAPHVDDEPRSMDAASPDCVLVRRGDLVGGSRVPVERPGRAHWRHPVRLVHSAGEARREPGAPYQAAPSTSLPVSIVVVAYQGRQLTSEALDAVLAHSRRPFELVLVDNGSRDGTQELFLELERRRDPAVSIQVLRNAENLGYPLAANQGARAARGRHVVLLNNDTRVRPGWLEALLAAASSAPKVGVVTAKVLNMDGTVQSSGGVLHHPDGAFTIPHASEDRLAPTVTERRELDNAGGPCLLLTRELLEAVAPDGQVFDPAFTPGYFEDSDLCLRAREAGFSLLCEPAAEVSHHGKATANLVAREGRVDVWGQFERNKRRFYERWRGRLEADERRRREREEDAPRLKVVLCYHRSATTTAAHLERALRREHDVVAAGRGQPLDLGGHASAKDLVEAAGGDADLLLVVEGETYLPRSLETCPCPTALWAIDNHLHADPARVGQGGHFALARAFDHLFIAQRDYEAAFRARGLAPTWLPLACAPDAHARAPAPAQRDLDVVFVGHVLPIHSRRRALLDRLRVRFRLEERQGVFGEDMARLHARAKVVFNCSLAGDLNMRVFEGLASGAVVVTDRIENGLERFFAPGEHLLAYDDRSLEDVVAAALADDARRVEVAGRGQRLALRHHTYLQRARDLVRVVRANPVPREHVSRPRHPAPVTAGQVTGP